ARRGVPQSYTLVGAGGSEQLAVGGKIDAVDFRRMASQLETLLAVGGLQQADRLVRAAAGQHLAVPAERQRTHSAGVSLSLERRLLVAVADFPEPDHVITTAAARQQLVVGGKGHGPGGVVSLGVYLL